MGTSAIEALGLTKRYRDKSVLVTGLGGREIGELALTPTRSSLEDAFMELTQEGGLVTGPSASGTAASDPDTVPAVQLATWRWILLGDHPHPRPGQCREWRPVRVWLSQRHACFEGDIAGVSDRHSHNIGDDDDIGVTTLVHKKIMTC